MLCLVDDAHWLDPASAGALLFCTRRLGADRVAMVFASRDGAGERFEATGVQDLALKGLGGEASRALLAEQLGSQPAESVITRLVEETRGNPLVLLDSTSPYQFDAIPSYPLQYALMRRAYGILPSLARLGLGPLIASSHLPAEDAAPVVAMAATPRSARNQEWPGGRSWRLTDTYIVIEQSPDMLDEPHDRKRPGLNHLAFHAGDQARVDALTAAAADHGWALMFANKHPHSGGQQTYAAYLSSTDGYEVELTASNP